MKVYNMVSVQRLGKFTSNKNNVNQTVKKSNGLSQSVIEHFGINMETKVGYKGEITPMPAPQTVQPNIARFLENLGVDWRTHVGK